MIRTCDLCGDVVELNEDMEPLMRCGYMECPFGPDFSSDGDPIELQFDDMLKDMDQYYDLPEDEDTDRRD